MKVLVAVVASLFMVSACAPGITERAPAATPSRTLGPGEKWLPFAPDRAAGGAPVLCGGMGWTGGHQLTGSPTDPRLVWMMAGERYELEWPVGYSARFNPRLELLDGNGKVVGREGTELAGGARSPRACGKWTYPEQQRRQPEAGSAELGVSSRFFAAPFGP